MQFFLSTYYLILWNGLIIVTEEIMLNEYLMRKKIPDATTDMNVVQEEYRQVIKDVQKNADKIVNEKDKEIERLLALNKELRNEMKVQKARNIKNREYVQALLHLRQTLLHMPPSLPRPNPHM